MSLAEQFADWYGGKCDSVIGSIGDARNDVKKDLEELMRIAKPEEKTELGTLLETSRGRKGFRHAVYALKTWHGSDAYEEVKKLVDVCSSSSNIMNDEVAKILKKYEGIEGAKGILETLHSAITKNYLLAKTLTTLMSPKLLELVRAYQGSEYVHEMASIGVDIEQNRRKNFIGFFLENKDHPRIYQAIEAYNEVKNQAIADYVPLSKLPVKKLTRALSVYFAYRNEEGIDKFLDEIEPNLPEEIREELDLREIRSVTKSYAVLDKVCRRTRKRQETFRDSVEEAFFSIMATKLNDGETVSQKKQILYEWSEEFQRIARDRPDAFYFRGVET